MKQAIKLGLEGKKISYDPASYNRMGADRWNAYVKKVQSQGKEPDYSEHHLSQIFPLPATATDFQKEQHKKWCAKFNEAAADPDPMKATIVKKQYLNWIKDEGLGAMPEAEGGKKPNPYLASAPAPTPAAPAPASATPPPAAPKPDAEPKKIHESIEHRGQRNGFNVYGPYHAKVPAGFSRVKDAKGNKTQWFDENAALGEKAYHAFYKNDKGEQGIFHPHTGEFVPFDQSVHYKDGKGTTTWKFPGK